MIEVDEVIKNYTSASDASKMDKIINQAKRIEELEGLLREVLDNDEYCEGENMANLPRELESRIKKALEVKQ